MERRELPQVGHVDGGSVSDQQLCHLVVTVRTGVMEGNQTTVEGKGYLLEVMLTLYMKVMSITHYKHIHKTL